MWPHFLECGISRLSHKKYYCNSTFGHTPKRTENRDSNKYLYTDVHSNIIHNSKKVEATQMSTDKQMDKQNVIYP